MHNSYYYLHKSPHLKKFVYNQNLTIVG